MQMNGNPGLRGAGGQLSLCADGAAEVHSLQAKHVPSLQSETFDQLAV